jgi:hypothetical protein
MARATASAGPDLGSQSPYIPLIPLAAVGAVATVVVMDVPAFARAEFAGWLRQRWRLTGEESLTTKLLRRLGAA